MGDSIEVSRDVGASAGTVWEMVADITRMGEWSPETVGAKWSKGATGPAPGASFRGTNRAGKKSWSTTATVVDADPGRRFSFRVVFGPFKVAEWAYDFEPTATGCRVTESWHDQRVGFFKPIARMGTGVADRAARNRATMETTLERLAAAAESAEAVSGDGSSEGTTGD